LIRYLTEGAKKREMGKKVGPAFGKPEVALGCKAD
jgi:hypothetical protein